MQPFDILLKTLSVDQRVGRYLFSGLGLMAAVAIAASYGIQTETAFLMAIYFLGLTAILLILVKIFDNKIIGSVLAWFMTIVFIAVVLLMGFSSIFPNQGYIAPSYCLVRFWERCSAIEESLAGRRPAAVAAPQPIPAPANVDPSRYSVTVQFAGLIDRDDVRTMMTKLQSAGWNVQGVSGGGQRTQNARGSNEVRYGAAADELAARSLAASVSSFRLSGAPVSAQPTKQIPAGQLEVWISK